MVSLPAGCGHQPVLLLSVPGPPQKQLNTSTVAVQDLQTLLEQTSAALVASQARLMETHAAAAAAAASPHGSPTRSAELQQEIKALKVRCLRPTECPYMLIDTYAVWASISWRQGRFSVLP